MKATELQQRLASEVEQVEWDALDDHYKRGALFEVSVGVPLVKVAMAIALDCVNDVREWLESGDLVQVSESRAEALRSQPKLQMTFLIVQPYVLITEAPPASGGDDDAADG